MSRQRDVADARRSLRFWASAILALLIAITAMQLEDGGFRLALGAFAVAAVLVLVLRQPRPSISAPDRVVSLNSAAQLAVMGGLILACAAVGLSHTGERARIGSLCEGQTARLGGWDLTLRKIEPVAGEGFTALQATIEARRGSGAPVVIRPEQRSYFSPHALRDTASTAQMWNGDLVLDLAGYNALKDCLAFDASWRPFAVWAWLGSWLAALGAAVMAMLALVSIHWRRNARARIAMRREDRPLPRASTANLAITSMPSRAMALTACILAAWMAYFALDRLGWLPATTVPPNPGFGHGAEMVSARQSLLEGPANLNRWIVIADAMARRGNFGDASEVLLGAVENEPRNVQAWLALGDALFGHAGGQLSQAAVFAYMRADRPDLREGRAPLLVATAMARSGRTGLARSWLHRQLKAAPSNSPWRSEVEQRLAAPDPTALLQIGKPPA